MAYRYTVLPFQTDSGPLHFYEVHVLLRGVSFPSKTDGNLHSQLPRRLAHSGQGGVGATIAQNTSPHPTRAPGALFPSQRVLFLGTVLDSAQMRALVAPEHALAIQKLAASFKSGTARPIKTFQRILVLMATASPVLQLGLLHMGPLQRWLKPRVPPHAWRHGRLHIKMSQACVTALALWTNPHWMEKDMAKGMACSRKVASNTGRGCCAKANAKAFGLW